MRGWKLWYKRSLHSRFCTLQAFCKCVERRSDLKAHVGILREMLSVRRRINLSHMRDSCHKLGMKLNQGNSEVLSSWQEQEERFPSNVLGHLPDKLGDEDPWKQMKWVGSQLAVK